MQPNDQVHDRTQRLLQGIAMKDQTRDLLCIVARILLWCWVFSFVLLFIWLGAILLLRDFIHELHGPMFGLSSHELNLIFYCAMGLLKIGVLTLFFIPWLSISLILRNQNFSGVPSSADLSLNGA